MKKNAEVFINRIVAMALAIAMACPYAYAADVGKITYIEGRVDVARAGSDIATPLREGDAIAIGDAVRTKSSSKAEVTFNDKSMLRLAQNTRVEVKDYVLDANNKRKTAEIMVDRGKTRTIIAKMPDKAEFNISTPNARGTVKGSDVFTSFQAGSSNMLVAEGRLSIVNPAIPGNALIVPAGNSIVVPLNEAPQAPRAYLELEKKAQEADTFIPATVSRNPNATTIKGVFVKISGNVRLTPKDSGPSRMATINDTVNEGDTVETGADGLAEISFENGNGMNLSQNTKVSVTKLSQDPKTNQYDNKFDVSMGKVKSRIEKLKETKSTFEVRTPTAICGARATLMYIEITPTATRVFFEGGVGDLQSAISGIRQAVEMGHVSYADNNGNIGIPYVPSEGERMNWTAGLDQGNGTEGYSSSGGTVGVFLNEGGVVDGVSGGVTETGLQEFFSDPLFTIGITVIEEPLTSSGSFYSDIRDYDSDSGVLQGAIGLRRTFWDGGTANLESIGTYASDYSGYPVGSPFIWFGSDNPEEDVEGETINEGFFYSHNPSTGKDTTYDNGAFYGNAVGIAGGGIMEGYVKALYIDPDGDLGIAGGTISGLASGGVYIFTSAMTGKTRVKTIDTDILLDNFSVYVSPVDRGHLYGSSGRDWSLDGYDNLYTMCIVDGAEGGAVEQWGIYHQQFYGGIYSGEVASGWTARMGGSGIFGTYKDSENSVSKSGDTGYWLADIKDGTWAEHKLTAKLTGDFMTHTKIGTMSGDILGTYSGASDKWHAVGIGEWETSKDEAGDLKYLKFVSDVSSELKYYGGFSFNPDGSVTGILGGTGSLWDPLKESASIMLMGVMETSGASHIWSSQLKSYNYFDGVDTTYDDDPGAYYGFVEGIHKGSSVEGRMMALYIGPKENGRSKIGYLGGSLDGAFYEEIGFLDASGTLSRYEIPGVTVTVNPEDIAEDSSVYKGNISAKISGLFDGSGCGFYGAEYSDTPQTTLSIISQKWGIFDLPRIGGTSDSTGSWSADMGGEGDFGAYYAVDSEDPTPDSGFWLAKDMSGSWTTEKISDEKFTGTFLTYIKTGDVSGEFLGVDNGNGSWQAIGIGTWGTEKSTPLAFANDVSVCLADISGLGDGNYYSAIMGGTGSIWESGSVINVMGDCPDQIAGPRLWINDEIISHDFVAGTDTTYDGGFYQGYMNGICAPDYMKATCAIIYTDDDGDPGVLISRLSGDYFSSLGMFDVSGSIESIQPFDATGGSISILKSSTSSPYTGDSFSTMRMYDSDSDVNYDWGAYAHQITGEGFISGPTFLTNIGGNNFTMARREDTHEESYEGYWLADLSSMFYSDGTMDGSVSGTFITDYEMGSMSGYVLGIYSGADWKAVGAGSWTAEDLVFGGDFTGRFGYFDYAAAEEGYKSFVFDASSSITGLYGGTVSIWNPEDAKPAVTFMGMFSNPVPEQNTLWIVGGSIVNNAENGLDVKDLVLEYGEGRVLLIAGATHKEDLLTETYAITGLLGGIYILKTAIEDDGKYYYEAGLVSSSLTGKRYDGIGMFELSGELEPDYKSLTLISPDQLSYDSSAVEYMNIDGNVSGDLTGFIGGDLVALDDDSIGSKWGLWRFAAGGESPAEGLDCEFNGVFAGVFHDTDKDDDLRGCWISELSGRNSNGYIDADMNGIWLNLMSSDEEGFGMMGGVMSSTAIGNDNGSTWQLLGIGQAEEKRRIYLSEIDEIDDIDLYILDLADDAGLGLEIYDGSIRGLSGQGLFYDPNDNANNSSFDNTMDLSLYRLASGLTSDGVWAGVSTYWNWDGDFYQSWDVKLCGVQDEDDYRYIFLDGSGDSWRSESELPEGLEGSLRGMLLTAAELILMDGGMVGYYDETAGQWKAAAAGKYEIKPLAWSASAESEFYYHDGYGLRPVGGYPYGCSYGYAILGTLESPFASLGTPVDIFAIGEYNGYDYSTWWGFLSGNDIDGSVIPVGYIGGDSTDGRTVGVLSALYIDENGNAGTLYGEFDGRGAGDLDMWSVDNGYDKDVSGHVTADEKAKNYDPQCLQYGTNTDIMKLSGHFICNGEDVGAIVSPSPLSVETAWLVKDDVAENWGIFCMGLGGTFEEPINNNWTANLSGASWQETDMPWLAKITGDRWSEGLVTGDVGGVWFKSEADGNIAGGTIQGKVLGSEYIEVEAPCTWQAAGVGEWVEVEDLIITAGTIDDVVRNLGSMVNVPITVAHQNLLTGTASCGAAMNMDMHMYALSPVALSGIWLALIDGTGTLSNGWTCNLQGDTDTVNLVNGTLTGNNWTADVTGMVNNSNITGTASGTNIDNNITGSAAGTYAPLT